MAWAPLGPRGLRGSLGRQDPWEKGDQLVLEVFQASKAQKAALGLEGQGDSQAPKGMWGPQGQRDPQGLRGPQGLKESQGSQGRQGHQASGGPRDPRVSRGSRVPLAFLGPQAHQEARAPTEEVCSPDIATSKGNSSGQCELPRKPHPSPTDSWRGPPGLILQRWAHA